METRLPRINEGITIQIICTFLRGKELKHTTWICRDHKVGSRASSAGSRLQRLPSRRPGRRRPTSASSSETPFALRERRSAHSRQILIPPCPQPSRLAVARGDALLLTVVTLRDGRHAHADAFLFGDGVDGVGAVDVGEGQSQVLLHRPQAKVFGVQVDERTQQGGGAVLAELPAAPQALLLHATPQGACGQTNRRTDGKVSAREGERGRRIGVAGFPSASSDNVKVQSQSVRM